MPLMRIAALALIVAVTFAPRSARAAVTGAIEGTVTDQGTGKRLAGITVTVTSPALQGEQTEFTDPSGHYIITELPPGEYLVRFYFADRSSSVPACGFRPTRRSPSTSPSRWRRRRSRPT